jgi:hypothetical protein
MTAKITTREWLRYRVHNSLGVKKKGRQGVSASHFDRQRSKQ